MPHLGEIEPAFARHLEGLHRIAEAPSGGSSSEPAADSQPAASSRGSAADIAETYGRLGKNYAAFGFLDAAEVALSNAEAVQPEDPRWPYFRGLVAFDRGAVDEAALRFERAVELDPKDAAAAIHLGKLYLELQRTDEARHQLDKALELDPRAAAGHYRLGELAALTGDWSEAAARYAKALELQPQATAIHYSLARAYRQLGDSERAGAHLARHGEEQVRWDDPLLLELGDLVHLAAFEAVEERIFSSEPFAAAETLGFALRYLGELEGGVEEIERYLDDLRSSRGALGEVVEARFDYLLGGFLIQRGDDSGAIERLRRAIDRQPELIDARVKLANALARSRRGEEALSQYSAVLEREPSHGDARLRRAAVLLGLGRWQAAEADLEQVIELEPDDATPRARLAAARLMRGDVDGFERQRRALLALELEPGERARVHLDLARASTAVGRYEAAEAEYRAVLEIRPGSSAASLALADLAGHRGRFDDALARYRAVVAADPSSRRARLGEITALLLLERRGEARSRLEAALRELPADAALAHVLARLLAIAPEDDLRDGARALTLIASETAGPSTTEAAETLAMVYAEVGRFAEARAMQQQAVAAIEQSQTGSAADLPRRRLRAYAGERPWRASSPIELILTTATPASADD
ncbi:MAG: tetratricopeptide repeat protein [Acidobacteriota bacterium]